LSARAGRFDPYVSRVASEWDSESPGSLWRVVNGSLVFVDISGFTSLSERLARKGRIGAEELTVVLDRVFGRMLEVVFERGGSLLKFGGDALLLLFETEDHVLQACAATVEMRAALRDAAKEPTSVGRIRLKMSSGVHTGPVDFFLVGDSHRELIVTGPTASITTAMEGTADAGEIVVSSSVRAQLPADFTGSPKGHGWLLRKQKINQPLPDVTSPRAIPDEELEVLVSRGLRAHLAAGVADSEHRISTVGFVGFEGVDPLLAEEGPERVGADLERLVTVVQKAVDTEGITFLASDIAADGGKIILTAGVPSSQPDDEGRMLRAARRILDSEPPLTTRIGVNRGHVFSGNVGTTFRSTYTVMGDTVNLAARFMAAAQPGMLYASPAALDRSSTLFRTEVLEPFHVKGKEQPVQAYAVHEETGVRPHVAKHELPFAGRDDELALIVGIVTTCAQVGSGGMMTITGDTGTGKSRLIAEVLAKCPGLATLMVQAEPNGADNPFWAFRDPMRRMLGIDQAQQPAMVSGLKTAIKKVAPELKWAIPLIGDVMHIDVPDTEETAAIDPRFRPERTADAVIELFDAVQAGPFAVLAEDGHFMDEPSIELLRRIGVAAESRPWTVIFTARRDRDRFEPLGEEISLEPLDEEAVRYIAIKATDAAPLRPHELDAVVTRSGGNPLFLSEILRMIRETGSAEQLPESLDAVVSSDIDTLPPLTRQLLRYSAVLGGSFRRVVLDEYLAPEPVEMDDATRKDLGRFIDDDGADRLRFRHAVVHDVAYEGLSYRRRRQLNSRAGEVIERLAGDDPEEVAESLATHYSRAGEHDKVWHYARVAADRAKRTYANTEAAVHYRHAIEAARHLTSIEPAEVAEIWTRIGEVEDLAGQYEAAREAYGRALRADRGDPARSADLYIRRAEAWVGSGVLSQAKRNITLGRKRLDSTDETTKSRMLARLDAYEATIHAANGDPVKALQSATSAVGLARSVGEEEALARAYGVRDWANFMMGLNEPRHGEEAIEILQRLGFLERSVIAMNNLGVYAHLEGKWDEAVAWYRKAVEAAERSGNVVEAAWTRANIAEVLVGQRKYEEAIPLLDEAERVFRASNALQIMPFVRLQRARAAVGSGDVDGAVDDLEALFAAQLEDGDTSEDPEIVVHLADVLVSCERPADALDRLDRFQLAAPDDADQVSTGIARVRGLASAALGQNTTASEAFDRGLKLAGEDGDLYEEALLREARVEARGRAGEDPDTADIDRFSELFRLLGIVSVQPV